MATKRVADTVLTHDNWNDDDDEDEEVGTGTFHRASQEVLKGREIVKARRRKKADPSHTAAGGDSSGNTTSSGGVFKGFSFGLAGTTSATQKEKLFSFVPSVPGTAASSSSCGNGASAALTNLSGAVKSGSTKESSVAIVEPLAGKMVEKEGHLQENVSLNNDMKGTTNDGEKKNENKKFNSEYADSLRSLNKSVVEWIVQHVDENPYCILSPIFVDYNRYVAELDEKRSRLSGSPSASSSSSTMHNVSNNGSVVSLNNSSATGIATFSSAGSGTLSSSGFRTPSTTSTYSSASLSTNASFGFSSCSGITGGSGTTQLSNAQPLVAKGPEHSVASSWPSVSANSTSRTDLTSPLKFGSSVPLSTFSFALNTSPSTVDAGKATVTSAVLDGSGTQSPPKSTAIGLFQFSSSSSVFSSPNAKPVFSFGTGTTSSAPFGALSSSAFGAASSGGFGAASSGAFGAGFFKPSSTASSLISSTFTSSSSAAAPFSFGSTTTMPGFKFGQFGTSAGSGESTAPSSDNTGAGDAGNDGEEGEYVPPKPEVVEHTEEGAFYTVRCKLFYMKNGSWVDRGVGNLHLKRFNDTKTQLIVRADTTLGNILLNIMLSESIPVKQMDATRVSIMCVPNPPIDERAPSDDPIAMLVKVKSAEQAEELMKQIKGSKST